MIVRGYIGWPWYAASLIALVALVATIVWLMAQRGEAALMFREVQGLRARLSKSEEELGRLRVGAAAEANAVQMERSTQQQLLLRIKKLEQQNVGLKEEVSLLERLVRECPRGSSTGRPN